MDNKRKEENNFTPRKISRRDLLKGLATVPVVGALAYGLYNRNKYFDAINDNLLHELNFNFTSNPVLNISTERQILIGIIGCGRRGIRLLRSLGFAHPEYIDRLNENSKEKRLHPFLEQEDLNVEITALCEIYDIQAERGIVAGSNIFKQGRNGRMGRPPKRYRTYQELINADDVDAIIIATPDHLHASIAIEAAKNGKHVYCEKPLSWSLDETYSVRNMVKDSGIVFQLGHQNRQVDSYHVAKKIIEQGALGKISLIEVCTNRNSSGGAWIYPIHPEANEKNIDWTQFQGPAPWHEFSLERFFRWRCWWDYSSGLCGDLFTHDYDAMNQILNLGIPSSAMASGGIYYYKDGRTVPDVLNMAFEFEKQDLSLLYSATQASERERGRLIMGSDASLKVGDHLEIMVEANSELYKERIQKGLINPDIPVFTYMPGDNTIDAITSPTEKYFAGRGLLYTFKEGKQVITTHMHLREWLDCIRLADGTQPSCNIDRAFEEGITSLMGTISYKEERKVYWDSEKEKLEV